MENRETEMIFVMSGHRCTYTVKGVAEIREKIFESTSLMRKTLSLGRVTKMEAVKREKHTKIGKKSLEQPSARERGRWLCQQALTG